MDKWLSKYVDAVILMNLKERTDRLEETKREFIKVGITEFILFPAVKNKIGISGCTQSHYEIVKLAKENGYKNILIFEDDVTFEHSKEEFRSILENTFKQIKDNDVKPDFLFLGGNLTSPPDGKFYESPMKYHKKIDENLYFLGGCKTTHAYIVYESAYDAIIDGLGGTDWNNRNEFRGDHRKNIDFWYLSRIFHEGYKEYGDIEHRSLNPYGVYPCLADQRVSYSDIQNSMLPSAGMVPKWNRLLTESND
jgi:hypothetical protein